MPHVLTWGYLHARSMVKAASAEGTSFSHLRRPTLTIARRDRLLHNSHIVLADEIMALSPREKSQSRQTATRSKPRAGLWNGAIHVSSLVQI